MKRIAVVGAGIAGLAAARELSRRARVTLFEAADHFGGHTHTVDVTLDGRTFGVDTGFLVFNERTYPKLVALFAELGVATAPADMSFSAQIPAAGIEWSSSGFGGVFAQASNLLRPAFWNMLGEIVRFNRLATALARSGRAGKGAALDEAVGDFLDAHRFSTGFRDWYFLPMVGSIWSCPTEQMLRMPVAAMVRFCANHGLLPDHRPAQWTSVRGGASNFDKMLERDPRRAPLDSGEERQAAADRRRRRCDRARRRAVRRSRLRLPQRPGARAPRRPERPRAISARSDPLAAQSRRPAHRCRRAAGAHGRVGSVELRAATRPGRQGGHGLVPT
jgi:uncharacterized protein with NAD-binding domain and iron-sulfur cluster